MEGNNTQQTQPVEEATKSSSNKSLLIVSLVVVALIVFTLSQKKGTSANTQNGVAPSPTVAQVATVNNYKDGVYEVRGEYVSPGGDEQIDVKLTLKGNVVSDAEVVPLAVRPNSVKFQGEFVAGYKQFVVGKKLDEINIQKVSGSSLTSKGFRDALDKVKAQAKG